jgi:hypothetical protein
MERVQVRFLAPHRRAPAIKKKGRFRLKTIRLLLFLTAFAFTSVAQQTQGVKGAITAGSASCPAAPALSTACVSMLLGPSVGAVVITVSGSYSGTLNVETSADSQVTFPAQPVYSNATQANVTTITGTGTFRVNPSGFGVLRVRASAGFSGTANVTMTPGTQPFSAGNGAGGGGTIGGSGTTNQIPLFSAAAAIANSHLDDGGTVLGNIFSSEPVTISASGNGISYTEGAACTPASGQEVWCAQTNHTTTISSNNGAFGTIKTGLNAPPDPASLGGLLGFGSTTGITTVLSDAFFTNLAPGANTYFAVAMEEMWLSNITVYLTTANTSGMWRIDPLCCLGASGQDYLPFLVVPNGAAAGSVTAFPNATAIYLNAGNHIELHATPLGNSFGTLQAISARMLGTTKGMMGTNQINAQVAGGGVTYTGPGQKNGLNANSSESLVEMPMPFALTVDTMCVYVLVTGQPSGGALNFTLDANGAGTSVVPTVPTSSGTSIPYCDQSHTATFAAGDRMSFKEVNTSISTGATIAGIDIGYSQTGGNVAAIFWGLGTQTITNADQYWMALAGTPSGATHGVADFPMPGAGTLDSLYCWVTTAPVTTAETITVFLNGVATAVTITLGTGQSVPANVTDLTHSFTFNAKDLITLKTTQGGTGTAPALGGCSARITWSS